MNSAAETAMLAAMAEFEQKAWDALARYKFWMFGYHAAAWVNMNRVGGFRRANPWRGLVKAVRDGQFSNPSLKEDPRCPRPASPTTD